MNDIVERLRLGISISRDRGLNLDFVPIAVEAADAITELRERCAFYERQNAEQAAMLNRVIAERDEYRAALEMITKMSGQYASQAIAKHTENEVEQAMMMV